MLRLKGALDVYRAKHQPGRNSLESGHGQSGNSESGSFPFSSYIGSARSAGQRSFTSIETLAMTAVCYPSISPQAIPLND